MTKNSKTKLLFTMLFLTILVVSSTYTLRIPEAQAAELSTPEKGLLIISNTAELDLSKYAATVKVYPQNYNASYLDVVPQTEVEYTFTAEGNTVRALCTFANSRLQMIHVLENEGSPHLSKTEANPLELAQNFLTNYQTYTTDSFYGELKSTLDNVDASKNSTKTVGNTQLEVIANNGYTTFKWTYTSNGAIAPAKSISLGFNNGFLTYFVDNWQLYPIGNTNVNLSEKEAISIALDAAKAHQWSLELDADALDAANFNESNVCWTNLFFDGSLYADQTRNEDPLRLYPVWRAGIALNKWYGQLYGITIDVWADTKEVRIVEEAWSTMTQTEKAAIANTTTTNESAIQDSVTSGAIPTVVTCAVLSTIAIATIGAVSVYVRKKKIQVSYRLPKLRSTETGVTLLCVLILSMVFVAPVATVNATSRVGVIWGSESSGAYGDGENDSWRKTNNEINAQSSLASNIESYFDTAGYNGEDQQGSPGSIKSNILGNITSFTDSYDCVAVVDFDHGVGNADGVPGAPSGEFHYMFEDDIGTRVGTYNGFVVVPANGVYDHEIYSNQSVKGKVFFAFINTCLSACINNTVGIYTTTQGFIAGTSRARGMPFAWMNRTIVDKDTAGFTTALNMSSDGYADPDEGYQCYIGFPYGSAALTQLIPYDSGSQYYYQWVDNFFDYALRYDMSVNMALDHASLITWDNLFGDCYLTTGFVADWPQYNGTWQNQTQGDCTMAVYGNGNVKLRYYSPGWNDNFNDNSRDTSKWDELENGATASETTGQLVVDVPSIGSGQVQAGYVTTDDYDVKDCKITIDVSEFNDIDEMILQICTTKTTNSDPYSQNSWYRILKASYDSKVYVQSRIGGGTVETKECMNWAGATGNLSIDICDGAIAFYENGYMRYAEPYALASYDCYIYAYTSTLKERANGIDKFDDFSLAPTPSFWDQFDDADNYYGWVSSYDWYWQVAGGKLGSTTFGAHIYVNQTFATNRLVKTDMETISHTGGTENVPWLFVKEQDGYNNVYVLIHTNGTLELSRVYLGSTETWTNSSLSLNPYDMHVLAVSIIGTNAKVWVDETLCLNVDDAYFDNIAGYVGLYTPGSRGEFDNVVIID
ncbi:hypothetical protein JXA31_09680 [Candidatus Bathyarchaeota archaeon]|nr:hypothetical protein [Candidatus Bathyarchaeota archaeon]